MLYNVSTDEAGNKKYCTKPEQPIGNTTTGKSCAYDYIDFAFGTCILMYSVRSAS